MTPNVRRRWLMARLGLSVLLIIGPDLALGADAAANEGSAAASAGSALQEVVVLGQYTSVEVARKAQQEAPNLINVQTYAEIKQLPDVSAGEALRRMPGISLETDEGEGRYVNCRGLDADLNSTTFGGLRLPPTNNASPFGGYRAVTFDSIPTGLIGALTVTKSNLPSQDAEALGCTIEITPKTAPLSGRPFLEGNAGSGYEPLRRTPIVDISLSGGGRFGGAGSRSGATEAYSDHPFSVIATMTYYQDQRGIDDVEPAYFNCNPAQFQAGSCGAVQPYRAINNIQQRDYELFRKRYGGGLEFGYQPDADNRWYVRGFQTGYNERYWRHFLNLIPDGNVTANPNGTFTDTLVGPANPAIQDSFRDEREIVKDQVFMAGGENHFGSSTLDYRLGYTKGSWRKPYDYNSAFTYVPPASLAGATPTITYGLNGRGNTPTYSITGADYLNAVNYQYASFGNSQSYNYDREWSWVTNFETPVHLGGFDSESVKTGISARIRQKEVTYYPTSNFGTPTFTTLNQITGAGNESYYAGQYLNPPDIPPGYIQGQLGAGTQQSSDVLSGQQNYLRAKEDVYAWYVQYQMTLGRFGVVGGVRIENTRDNYDSFNIFKEPPPSTAYTVTPISASHSYTNAFPGLQGKFTISEDLIARATWSSTLARPGFNQANASVTTDLGSGLINVGNPKLKPAYSNSFDLTLEYYLPHAGIAQIGLFDKELRDYIVAVQIDNEFVNFHGQPYKLGRYGFANSSSAYSRGAEFNYNQRFDMLPGLLQRLGFMANYTYVDSRFQIRPGEYSLLPSSSRNTWNAQVYYDYAGVNLRLAAYSVSADLFAIGADRSSDVYNDKRTSLDFGAAWSFLEHWGVYFNAKNLLNTPHTFYQGTPDRPIQREFYGLTLQAGFRVNY